jgi:3-deoxy-D-manno-octulosonic-acid transferase
MLSSYDINALKFSEFNERSADFKVLIVDQIGLLANLYQLGKVAFVGGSFESKVHNVLEPAACGIPVLFGPKINTQAEAMMLVREGAGFIVNSKDDIVEKMTQLLSDQKAADQIGDNAVRLVKNHIGASDRIIKILDKYFIH